MSLLNHLAVQHNGPLPILLTADLFWQILVLFTLSLGKLDAQGFFYATVNYQNEHQGQKPKIFFFSELAQFLFIRI